MKAGHLCWWKPVVVARTVACHGFVWRRVALFGPLLVPLLSLVSCSNSAKNLALAEQGVSRFHEQLDSEQYHIIYSGSDAGFRKATSEEEFVSFAQAVHRKLGRVQNASLRNFQVGWFAGQGTVVTLFYETQFEQAKAGERFMWHFDGLQPVLYGYNINSNALITK